MLEIKKHIGTLTNWTMDRHLQLITVVPSGEEHIGLILYNLHYSYSSFEKIISILKLSIWHFHKN